jgi:small conductance mechanosensitive channel
VIDSLEEKGTDVATERAFVDSVVETPPITAVRAAITTGTTWLTSMDGGGALALSALKAAAAITGAWFLAIFLARVARRAMKKVKKASALLSDFVVLSVRRMVLFIGLLIALSQLGVDMTPLLAAIGAAGLVVGLALQGTLSNFASGLLIMTNRPFDVGDLVSTSGIDGHVRGMTLLSTCIETLDSRTIFIPNNMVWGDTITNVTANPMRRLDLIFGIAYEDDFKKAQKILLELVENHPKVLSDPAPLVRVHELGDSSVNFAVRPWVHNDDYWEVHWDLTEAVKEHFDKKGVSIPFPQRDVHLIPVPGEAIPERAEPRPELQGEPT